MYACLLDFLRIMLIIIDINNLLFQKNYVAFLVSNLNNRYNMVVGIIIYSFNLTKL